MKLDRDRKFTFSIFLLVAAMIVPSTLAPAETGAKPVASQSSSKKMTLRLPQAETGFGFLMINKLAHASKTGNIFISPLSLHSCLQMAYDGASGGTATEMAKVLGLTGLGVQQGNKEYQALLKTVADSPLWLRQALEKKKKKEEEAQRDERERQKYNKEAEAKNLPPLPPNPSESAYSYIRNIIRIDPPLQVTVANSIWANKGTKFAPPYVADCKKFFHAQVQSLNFRDRKTVSVINDWVSNQTNGKINNAMDRLNPEDLAILINVAYFKARWSDQFDPDKTKPALFHAPSGDKDVSMMHQWLGADYLQNAEFQAVKLNYRSGSEDYYGHEDSMYIFLPRKSNGLAELLPKLTASNWKHWLGQFATDWPGELFMPKFEMSYETQCSKVLASLGMPLAFSRTGGANFSKMVVSSPKPLFLSEVYHKTFLRIDEQGTEAAAYTAVSGGGGGDGVEERKPFEMVIDHPFFFAIVNNKTGAPLFMGTVSDPTSAETGSPQTK